MPQSISRQILAQHLRHPPATFETEEAAHVIISIKPAYADLIARGVKQVEFRRRFPRNFQTGQAIFYITSPVSAIAMVARVTAVRRATPMELWREFNAIGGTARNAFNAYFTGITTGVALLLDQVRPLKAPIPLNDPRLRAIAFKPPQSLAVLSSDSPLPRIVAARSM